IDAGETLLDAEPFLDRLAVLANPAATGAGQVAGVQRFEHQHQREALLAVDLLLDDVAGHGGRQAQRKSHECLLNFSPRPRSGGEGSKNIYAASTSSLTAIALR